MRRKPRDDTPGYQQLKLYLPEQEMMPIVREVEARLEVFSGLIRGFEDLAQEDGPWAEIWKEENQRWK